MAHKREESPSDPLPSGWVMISAPPLRQRLGAVDEVILFVPVIFVGAVPPLLDILFGDITLWGALLALAAYLGLW